MKETLKALPIILVLLLSAGNAVGQQYPLFWTYGYDEEMDYPCSIERLIDINGEDQGCIIAGRTQDKYASVIGVNPRGIQEWEWQLSVSEFGIIPIGDAMSVIHAENGIIVAGWVTTSDNEDVFLARLTEDGNLDWQTIHRVSGYQKGTDVCTVISQSTGEVTGYAVAAFDQDTHNILLIIFDLQGNIEEYFAFNKTYIGHCYRPSCILQTGDGGYAIGGLAGIQHWYPNLGLGFLLKIDSSGQEEWCHTSSVLDHGAYGQCLIQRPNGNFYLLGMMGDGLYDYYPDATVIEIDQDGDQLGSPRQFTEIAEAAYGIMSFGFSLEPFKTPELHYAVCGEVSDINEDDYDLFFMTIDDNLNITNLSIHGLNNVYEGTIKENHRPSSGAVACKVFSGSYILTAPTTYRESWPNRDIYLSKYLLNDGNTTGGSSEDGASNPLSITVRANPCNETASVSICLPSAGNVNISVYDIQGRLVSTIADKHMSEGNHIATWNAVDDNGNSVSSGVYFIHLQTEVESETASLVLVNK